MTDIIWNKVLRKSPEPRLDILRDRELNVPDWKGGASIPAKPTRAFLLKKHETSPISAMSWEPRTEPTPKNDITTSYSGKVEARAFISFAKEAMVSLMQFNWEIALELKSEELSLNGKDGEQLQAKS